jgi:hypothetical protein
MTRISLTSATLAQLVSFATVTQGLDVASRATKADVMALIAASGFTGTEIEVSDEEAASTRKPITAADLKGRKMVCINIPVQEHLAGGEHPVPVGCNGTVAVIQRGVDVEVPIEYVEILRHAKKKMPVKDENSRIIGWTETLIYPFSIVALVD